MPALRHRYRLDLRAILSGTGLGFVLVLAVLLSFFVLDFSESVGLILLRMLAIYFPTGFVAGAQAQRARAHDPATFYPPALHAFIAGGLLTVVHVSLWYAVHGGLEPPLGWLLIETLTAAAFSAIAGIFGELYATTQQIEGL